MISRLYRRLLLALLPVVKVESLPEDQVQAQIDRGLRAKALLDDPTLNEALLEITARVTAEWQDTAAFSQDKREVLYHQVAAVDALKGQLKRWSEDQIYLAARLEKAKQ